MFFAYSENFHLVCCVILQISMQFSNYYDNMSDTGLIGTCSLLISDEYVLGHMFHSCKTVIVENILPSAVCALMEALNLIH